MYHIDKITSITYTLGPNHIMLSENFMSHSYSSERYRQAKLITLIGAFLNAFLGVLKWVCGIWLQSHALIADGLHSLSDLLSDGMVLVASKFGSQHADERHPYGHQRFETAATLMLSLLLILAGLGIMSDAFFAILHHEIQKPKPLALAIALISMITNEVLYYYTHRVGEKINSLLIIANAWHHRSDSLASLVVLIGIFGSLVGITWLDAAAALFVGFMIINMGREYGWQSVRELVDTAVSEDKLNNISITIQNIDGVLKIHQLRSRTMGKDVYIDVHVIVSPTISVSEGHYIAQKVHQSLKQNYTEIKDVTVHIDPEDDEVENISNISNNINALDILPSRVQLEESWLYPWQKLFPDLLSWNVHYLENSITLDLYFNPTFNQWDKFNQYITESLQNIIYTTRIHFYCDPKKMLQIQGNTCTST